MNPTLRKGDRIRLKVRTVSGWKGAGTVLHDCYGRADVVHFHADGTPAHWVSTAVRHEVSRLRDQTQ